MGRVTGRLLAKLSRGDRPYSLQQLRASALSPSLALPPRLGSQEAPEAASAPQMMTEHPETERTDCSLAPPTAQGEGPASWPRLPLLVPCLCSDLGEGLFWSPV